MRLLNAAIPPQGLLPQQASLDQDLAYTRRLVHNLSDRIAEVTISPRCSAVHLH